jgi:hypothetical protein
VTRRSWRLADRTAFALAPVLALLTMLAWVFASPIGAAPDDDFHLVSTWCAGPSAGETCLQVEDDRRIRMVPEALDGIACFAPDPTRSAACQGDDFSWSTDVLVDSDRANVVGAYPPVFYAVMGALTTDDIQASALWMRVLTVVVFLGILVALFLLLPAERRPMVAWGWLITTIPLGVFILASNNPSAWAVIGVGTSWMALLGWFESTGRRQWALGALFVLGVIMAAGSRGDAALYSGLGMVLVLVLTFVHRRSYYLRAILPVVMGVVALAFFLSARQSRSGLGGFQGGSNVGEGSSTGTISTGAGVGATTEALDPEQALSGAGLLAYNLLNAPYLWSGALGEWALGWLDTSMPAVVSLAAVAAFVAVGFVGIARMTPRKAIALGLLVAVLWALPVYVLQAGGDLVGEQVQPRYLLPLIVVLGGLLLLTQKGRPITLTRAQRFTVIAALAGSHFVALHLNIRRYVTGIDEAGVNLDAGLEWWWTGMLSPNVVWIGGSIAYLGLLVLLSRLLDRSPAADRDAIGHELRAN